MASSEGSGHNYISPFYHPHRGTTHAGFDFPRPDTDEEIEALFDQVKRTRDLGEMPHLSIEQKWHMVYNDWQIRWKEEQAKDDQKGRPYEPGGPAAIMHEPPEWYIKKFLDKTITPKQASSLLVSLRSKELRCVNGWLVHMRSSDSRLQLVQTIYCYSRNFCAGTDANAHQPESIITVSTFESSCETR
jgi:cytokinesis protein